MTTIDVWDVFGNDDDDESDVVEKGGALTSSIPKAEIIQALVRHWRILDPTLPISHRHICVLVVDKNKSTDHNDIKNRNNEHSSWIDGLQSQSVTHVHLRNICLDHDGDEQLGAEKECNGFDACIMDFKLDDNGDDVPLLNDAQVHCIAKRIRSLLVPRGCWIYNTTCAARPMGSLLSPKVWKPNPEIIGKGTATSADAVAGWVLHQTRCVQIAHETCPWRMSRSTSSSSTQMEHEFALLELVTTCLSVHERVSGRLTAHHRRRAVHALDEYGYCILTGLLHSQRKQCLAWGDAVLEDLHQAAKVLKQSQGIDLYNPGNSTREPQAYRELSMREDLRLDLRDGPALARIRQGGGAEHTKNAARINHPILVPSTTAEIPGDFLRGHAEILEIIRTAMNPTSSSGLAKGNFGRYNFDGRGPGQFQDLRVGIVGGIVSLPGAADQAIHADTPHLFENGVHLPPHYINVFTPGYGSLDDKDDFETTVMGVGPTAFVHGSHRLDFVARHMLDGGNDTSTSLFDPQIWEYLVRPRPNLGDVVMFDCRILHFGLSNTHQSLERTMLYANMTMHWFHDPKNWDDWQSLFGDITNNK
jgi:hypothetical protein